MDELDRMIADDNAEREAEWAEMIVTDEDAQRHAKFLKGWAKGKRITHQMGRFYSAGKWSTMIDRPVVEKMLSLNLAVGTVQSFTVVK